MKRYALVLAAVLAVTGCASTSTSAPQESPVAASSPAPVAAGDTCGLLNADEINQVLGTSFAPDGEAATDDATQTATCTYTMTDSSTGVDVPIGLVVVGESQLAGADSYQTNLDLAEGYFGNPPKDVQVPGAQKAYIVTNASTNSPVIGMLVGDRFLQVQVGVQDATPEQGAELAAAVAAKAG